MRKDDQSNLERRMEIMGILYDGKREYDASNDDVQLCGLLITWMATIIIIVFGGSSEAKLLVIAAMSAAFIGLTLIWLGEIGFPKKLRRFRSKCTRLIEKMGS